MRASSRLAGMRSPGRKSPEWTRARSWSRNWTYSGTWLSGWRWRGNIVSGLPPILTGIGLLQEPNCLFATARTVDWKQPSRSATNRERFADHRGRLLVAVVVEGGRFGFVSRVEGGGAEFR